MKDLYAPWRSPYSQSLGKTKQENTQTDECVFCKSAAEIDDAKNFILKRYKNCFAILNKYPYNAGHLMVLPYAHEKNLHALTKETRQEIIEVVNICVNAVEKALKADGVNVGLNLGMASGAGIPSHIHMHVLPRWLGDTNFLPALADTKVVSFDLQEIYTLLKAELAPDSGAQ